MTTKPKTRNALAKAAIPDPIFAAIAAHKAAEKEYLRLRNKLDEAKFEAQKIHGERPADWIWWRRDDVFFDDDHLDCRREEFFGKPGADRKQIMTEYKDAKARLAAAARAAAEWDQRAGITPLREQCDRTDLAERRGCTLVARTKPTTLSGAIAMITYLRRDIATGGGLADWHMPALKTVANALAKMSDPGRAAAGGRDNPKLTALAAKLDAEYARVRERAIVGHMHLAGGRREEQSLPARFRIWEDKLAGIPATNLEELKLKACYIAVDWEMRIDDTICQSIVSDLLDVKPTVSEEVAASYAITE